MRQMTGVEMMSNSSRSAFVAHRLRRAIFRGHSSFVLEEQVKFHVALLRITVSLNNFYFKISF
jgi:hypothetical protein